ncbi:MAG: NAD-dependent epimerase/dehydratase family protein [Chloroflexi bacterium]|nr:NAD-dependent epimerase/dehydratase family protein [Chloroflexota bacterium]
MFRNATALVAGGSGFIGANVILRLLSLGANVRATVHKKGAVIKDPRIDYLKCDLTIMEDCRRAVTGVDYVFMCAANTSGAAVIASTPLLHVTPNIVMNAQMLEASYYAKVKKFIWLSSNAAYPPSGQHPVKEDDMFNGDPYPAYFAVGWMKRYTEILCRLYSEKLKSTMPTVVLRPSNIYGPYDDYDFATSHVMAAMIRRVADRQDPIEVWGDGNDIRDLIYVDDMIDAIFLAAERLDKFDPVNIGLGKGYTLKEVLKKIIDIDGFTSARVRYDTSKPSMIPIRLIDISKAEAVLGFKPRTHLEEGIKKTLAWYKKTYLSGPAKQN